MFLDLAFRSNFHSDVMSVAKTGSEMSNLLAANNRFHVCIIKIDFSECLMYVLRKSMLLQT